MVISLTGESLGFTEIDYGSNAREGLGFTLLEKPQSLFFFFGFNCQLIDVL